MNPKKTYLYVAMLALAYYAFIDAREIYVDLTSNVSPIVIPYIQILTVSAALLGVYGVFLAL